MLDVKSIGELARFAEVTPRQLYEVADRADDFVQLYELNNAAAGQRKPRLVHAPVGALRRIQTNLLRNLLRPNLWPSRHSYGGVPGRNAVQNARRHSRCAFIYTTDIENFFQTISYYQVRSLFERLGCAEDVASLMAKLCTHEGHLAQGLITSPILADRAVRRVDARIAGLALQHHLIYTRFVDDISLSGSFSLDHGTSGIVALVRTIIVDSGFRVALPKEQSGSVRDGVIAITGLRYLNGHLDPVADYIQQLEASLEAHQTLSAGGPFSSMLFTKPQLQGKVDYVCSINPKRRRALRSRLGAIDWQSLQDHAIQRGLMVCRRTLVRVSAGPDAEVGATA